MEMEGLNVYFAGPREGNKRNRENVHEESFSYMRTFIVINKDVT